MKANTKTWNVVITDTSPDKVTGVVSHNKSRFPNTFVADENGLRFACPVSVPASIKRQVSFRVRDEFAKRAEF